MLSSLPSIGVPLNGLVIPQTDDLGGIVLA